MLIELQTIEDKDTEQGAVCSVVDIAKVLPFRVERTYHIYGVKAGVIRGHHAHKKLVQLLVCVSGAIKVVLDRQTDRQTDRIYPRSTVDRAFGRSRRVAHDGMVDR